MPVLAPVPDPRWGELGKLVIDFVTSAHSRRAYSFALDQFFDWYAAEPRGPFVKALVQEYRAHLDGTQPVGFDHQRSLSRDPRAGNEGGRQRAAARTRRGAKRLGARAGNWLTPEEATGMLKAPDRSTRIGCRDRAILALLNWSRSMWSASSCAIPGGCCRTWLGREMPPHRARSDMGEDDRR